MMELFGEQAIPTGIDYGTITVRDKVGITVTTLHRIALPGRTSPTCVGSVVEGGRAEDFTFNNMAVDVIDADCMTRTGSDLQQRGSRSAMPVSAAKKMHSDSNAYRYPTGQRQLWGMDAELVRPLLATAPA